MKKLGLLGERLSYSYSPQIHKLVLDKVKIDSLYSICEIPREGLRDFCREKILEFDGINITIPYKEDIIKYLSDIDSISREICAVNTIKVTDGKLVGFNTDYYGFGQTLQYYDIPVKNKVVYIIGTGGASKAVYHYLIDNQASEIVFINRSIDNHWAKDCKILGLDELKGISGDLVINCTPLGMGYYIDRSPLNLDVIDNFNFAVDLIYNPAETLFLRYGREQGLKTVNGLYMLVAQAAKSEEIWNEISINDEIIQEVYQEIKAN